MYCTPCASTHEFVRTGILAHITNGFSGNVTNILLNSYYQHMFSMFYFYLVASYTPEVHIKWFIGMWWTESEKERICGVHSYSSATDSYTHKRVLNNLSQMKNILFATCCLLRKCCESMIKVFHEQGTHGYGMRFCNNAITTNSNNSRYYHHLSCLFGFVFNGFTRM